MAPIASGIDDYALVDIDDTIKEVHGYRKQGSGYGYSGVRGLNALIGILSTATAAPVIIGARLRKGSSGSPRGAGKFIGDVLAIVKRLRGKVATGLVLLRADSAFYGHAVVAAAHRAGAKVSITARMDPAVKRAIATISEKAWTTIQYTDAIRDETTGSLDFLGGSRRNRLHRLRGPKESRRIHGRLVVRRIPELNAKAGEGQQTLFDTHRFHAFFTTTDDLDTVTADKTHRQHAIIEQVNADLKDSALAHLPSGKFTANAAWLVLATSPSTSRAPSAPSPAPTWAKHAAAPSAENSSPSPPGSRPPPGACTYIYPRTGPGSRPGPRSTGPRSRREPPRPERRHRPYDRGHQRKIRADRRPSHALPPPRPPRPKSGHPTRSVGGSRLSQPAEVRAKL